MLKKPSDPLNRAINQVLKVCQITIQSAVFLEKEISELRAANKQKQKRTRPRKQVASTEGLSVLEATALIAVPEEVIKPPTPPRPRQPSPPLQPRTRALPKCSLCKNEGRRRTACPDRPFV